MKHRKSLVLVLTLGAGLAVSPGALGVATGQVDTFEDGTTQNWVVGLLGAAHPAPPANISTGGPAGANDNFLLLTSVGGSGAGNRLTAINVGQWAGDYISAGLTSIRMDVNNLGSSELALRLLFADPEVGPPTDLAFSTEAIVVPAGSGWMSVVFPISVSDLTAGQGSVEAALKDVTEMRIFHSVSAGFPGESLVASLGVDNIQAAVPDGSPTIVLLGCGLVGLAVASRARRNEVSFRPD